MQKEKKKGGPQSRAQGKKMAKGGEPKGKLPVFLPKLWHQKNFRPPPLGMDQFGAGIKIFEPKAISNGQLNKH